MASQVRQIVGYSNYLFFSITVIAVLVFLLDASKSCGTVIDFCTISIFLLVFTVSMLMLLVLSLIIGWPSNYSVNHTNGKSRGGAFKNGNLVLFFLEDVNLKQLLMIPLGLGMVFAISFFAVLIEQPLLGIFGSGIVMTSIFFYTNSAMPVILIHGLYNGLVVLLRSQKLGILASSPIKVPDISIGFFDQELINQVLTQLLLVAPAEELFRIFMITVFLIFIKLKFNYAGFWPKVFAGGASISIWSSYHLITAI